jgi:hypothetical protein
MYSSSMYVVYTFALEVALTVNPFEGPLLLLLYMLHLRPDLC